MDINKWKRLKKSGSYKRKVQKTYQQMISVPSTRFTSSQERSVEDGEGSGRNNNFQDISPGVSSGVSVQNKVLPTTSDLDSDDDEEYICDNSDSEQEDEDDCYSTYEENNKLRSNLSKWAVEHNIPHVALNSLLKILNIKLKNILPNDARTLLQTNKANVDIICSAPGEYWHNGLKKCLKNIVEELSVPPDKISLKINIDGLPVFKSSKYQFWPILCSVSEIPLPPFVVGIYAGDGKPKDLDTFLGPFVTEMQQLQEGLKITDKSQREKIIHVKLGAFICDSPARAMIKGVSNFNSKHGCLKCTVVGEYSHKSNTVTFPQFNCPKRNDQDFREKKYGQHHKLDSPLLKLNIDMIEDFPVSDSLHLIDLGLMKRLLIGWRDGNFGIYLTKWSASDIAKVDNFLNDCEMPTEIHRSVRSLDILKHWKGSEFRSFLYYLSLVILKEVLKEEAYTHFMHFFCAITICSIEKHFKFLQIAEEMLAHFTEQFKRIYGKDYVTSNIHNLSHLVDEVKKFGTLQNFNAYEFENKLQHFKHMVRHGKKPLRQIARRIIERDLVELNSLTTENNKCPVIKKNVLCLNSFILSKKKQDQWFLTNDNHLVEFISVYIKNNSQTQEQDIEIRGFVVQQTQDAFEKPLKSSFLNIYQCDNDELHRNREADIFKISIIKCKM
ncbi:jg22545, partial [Pararge aegeria aegeria]